MEGSCLVFRVGSQLCALPTDCVAETMRPQPVREVAGAPPFVLGLAMIRGAPVPVLDSAVALGQDGTSSYTRFISLKVGERRVALAVHDVVGIRSIGPEQLSSLPGLLSGAAQSVISALATLDGALLVVIGAGKLVPEGAWSHLQKEAELWLRQ